MKALVVVDLRSPFVCLGTLVRIDAQFLELRHADLHDLRARNLEIRARALGVVMHEGEDRLAPSRQAGAAVA